VTPIASTPRVSAIRNAGAAFVLVGLIVGIEYVCRHYLMFWLPTIGTLRVNDMLSLVCAYSVLAGGLGFLTGVDWIEELASVGQALRHCVTSWSYTGWIVATALSLGLFPILDRLVWAGMHLPMLTSSARNSTVWLPTFAPVLKATSFIFVNGLFVPVGEEFLWRGFVQSRLARAISAPLAIGITAACFSLKHVLVDASFDRALTIMALGIIFGILAHRKSWRASAALHIFMNMLSSITALVLGLI
jgi:membrane protease YdiL (CAAX protease family)